MEEFHRGPYETAVEHGEILTEIRIPVRPTARAPTPRSSAGPATGRSPRPAPRSGWTAASSPTPGSGWPRSARTRPASRRSPRRCAGRRPRDELYARAGAIAAASCSPVTDNRGTADYKRHLADELTRRTLRRAVERIEAGVAGDTPATREGDG